MHKQIYSRVITEFRWQYPITHRVIVEARQRGFGVLIFFGTIIFAQA
jgi:hypothetical protein